MDERILPSHTVIPRQNSFGCNFLITLAGEVKTCFLLLLFLSLLTARKMKREMLVCVTGSRTTTPHCNYL